MQEADIRVDAARLHAGAWQVEGASEQGWRDVLAHDGSPAVLMPGWSVAAALTLPQDAVLLLLSYADGGSAIWVLDPGLRFICDFGDLEQAAPAEVRAAVAEAGEALQKELRHGLLAGSLGGAWAALRDLGTGVLAALIRWAPRRSRGFLVGAPAATLRVATPQGEVELAGEAAMSALQAPWGSIAGLWPATAGRAGRIEMPALSRPGHAESVVLVGRSPGLRPTYLCTESPGGLRYYVMHGDGAPSAVYVPAGDVFLAYLPLDEDALAELSRRLDDMLVELARQPIGPLPEKTAGLGLITIGLLNFGHVIWEEFHTLDVFLAGRTAQGPPPVLYLVEGHSGADLYGPVEDLYPEFQDRVIRVRSEMDAIVHGLNTGRELVARGGVRVLAASRARLSAMVERHALTGDLAQRARALTDAQGKPRLVITLGLRLTNRRPVDLLGFYVRLSQALVKRYGPIVVVLDGINGSNEPGKAAADVYNGARSTDASFLEARRDGSTELNTERRWAESFIALASRGVQVIDCVGMPIRDNLFWMSRSHFFVAPLGGGLAKVRWALDKPGLVLSSRTNLQFCNLIHIYHDEESIEGLTRPLYFTEPEDVRDVPVERAEPPTPRGVPYPEDFHLDENRLIPRIAELVARHAPVAPRPALLRNLLGLGR